MPNVYYTLTYESYKLTVQLISFITVIFLDVDINGLLLHLYVKALHIYSTLFAGNNVNDNMKSLDDRQHKLMLEAARYTVLFSAVLVFRVLFRLELFFIWVDETPCS